ncbi:MAG: hypothetical protein J1F01_07300 [Oscillospiraceae bacterium]|nr:hypothetical protein [Oscillospiraceae bacterium]
MGKLNDVVTKADNSTTVGEEVKEALAVLVNLAQEKAKSAEESIKLDLKTGKTDDNLTVPITNVVQSKSEYRAITETSSGKLIEDISSSIGEMFSGDKGILRGISNLVKTTLETIIGVGEGRESETHFYSVVAEYPAIVRYDFYIWGRNTKAKAIKTQLKSAFACVGYKSAVDMSKLDYNTFLTLYSPILNAAFGNDQKKLKEMIDESKKIYNMFNSKNGIALVDANTDKIVQEISAGKNIYKLPEVRVIEN